MLSRWTYIVEHLVLNFYICTSFNLPCFNLTKMSLIFCSYQNFLHIQLLMQELVVCRTQKNERLSQSNNRLSISKRPCRAHIMKNIKKKIYWKYNNQTLKPKKSLIEIYSSSISSSSFCFSDFKMTEDIETPLVFQVREEWLMGMWIWGVYSFCWMFVKCSRCRTIVGDSLAFQFADAGSSTIILSGVSKVGVSSELITEPPSSPLAGWYECDAIWLNVLYSFSERHCLYCDLCLFFFFFFLFCSFFFFFFPKAHMFQSHVLNASNHSVGAIAASHSPHKAAFFIILRWT